MRWAMITSQFPETHETFIARDAEALLQRGIDLEIFSLKTCKDAVRLKLSDHFKEGVHTVAWNDGALWKKPVPKQILSSLWASPKTCVEQAKTLACLASTAAIVEHLKQHPVDGVISHWINVPADVARTVAQTLNIPWVMMVHGENVFAHCPSLEFNVQRAARVVCCCHSVFEVIDHLRPEGVELIRHGLNWQEPPHYEGRDQGPLLAIGRLVPYKGFHILLEALRDPHFASLECVIVGEGPEKNRLQALAKHCAAQVRFVGALSQADVKKLLKEARVLIHPAYPDQQGMRDGFPNVVAEAMMIGCPVLVSDQADLPSLVDEACGALHRGGDHQDLKKALKDVLNDPGKRRERSLRAHRIIDHAFDMTRNTDQLVRTLQKALT